MAVFNNVLAGASGQTTGGTGAYEIERSLRFNSSDSAYLSRTPGSAGNRKTWTWAGWVKRSKLGTRQPFIISNDGGTANYTEVHFDSDDTIRFLHYNSNVKSLERRTTAVFRDVSSYYHIVISFDMTQATPVNRQRLYINGTEVTSFTDTVILAQNSDTWINAARAHYIGRMDGINAYADYYLADIHFIDGQALDPTSFTETDATTGQLVPIEYTGTYGTNGFHLPFSDNSSAAALGTDTSGNGNDWTVNNISVQEGVNYSSNVTTVATSIYSGTPATMFDGSISTDYGVTSNNGSNSSITIDLTGKGVSVSTGIRVYATYRNGMVWQINGNTVSSSGVSHPNTGWQTLSGWSAGVITSISTSVPSGSANGIYAIEIDGVILINITGAGNDSLVDTPTNGSQTDTGVGGEVVGNYATWNPLEKAANASLANGNLDISQSSGQQNTGATVAVSSGKWYWEVTFASGTQSRIGAIKQQFVKTDSPFSNFLGGGSNGYSYANGGYKSNANNNSVTGYSTYTTNDVVSVALDLDNGRIFFAKNGTWQESGNPASGTNPAYTGLSGTFTPAVYTPNATLNANFGQRPFAYTAPSGYKALCTTNLDDPVVAQPSTVMDVALYTGNGSTQTISGLGFSPDLVWGKARVSGNHMLADVIRGASKRLISNLTNAEDTGSALTSFNSDGFSVDGSSAINQASQPIVAWTWDAGSSTVSNTDGSITSSVRVNQTAGFSIVSYTGNGTAGATVGHGLNAEPFLIISKNRDDGNAVGGQWYTYHKSLGNSTQIQLQSTAAAGSGSSFMNSTTPTSSVFARGSFTAVNGSGDNFIAYCFAPVDGYSAFGSYTGNGSTDGPFVYTGFRPRWIMIKRVDNAPGAWTIIDTSRDAYNVSKNRLRANDSAAEDDIWFKADLVSNGFKLRDNDQEWNLSERYIYAAFAENPFKTARAR